MRFDTISGMGLACLGLASPIASLVISRDGTSTNSNKGLLSTLTESANDTSVEQTASDTVSSIVSLLSNKADVPQSAADVGSVQAALGKISKIHSDLESDDSSDLLALVQNLVGSGLIPFDLVSFLDGYLDLSLNSNNNKNPPPPSTQAIYPSKGTGDAPYSVPEEKLRAAIQIPDSFAYGKNGKKPVVLVPGTGGPAGMSFHFNFGKLAEATPNADVVWVNIPQASLNDVQENGEYVAYAVNYISAISSDSNVAVISWSQGGLDTQWALKYWPSIRDVVEDFIPISPDFRGTKIRSLVCPLLDPVICAPSIWQQGWDTEFIQALRADGGDSAYVPTTSVYSTFDEIVQPMSGENASAILADTRGVGVSNNHVQSICPNKPAGGVYLHEGVLYNALAWALAVDTLNHEGPGDPSRIDLDTVCEQLIPPQLQLDDVLGTEGIMLVVVAELLAYFPKVADEPPIVGYAS